MAYDTWYYEVYDILYIWYGRVRKYGMGYISYGISYGICYMVCDNGIYGT